MILEMIALSSISFGTGYFCKAYMTHLVAAHYDENECQQCHLKVMTPRFCRWEYRHTCTAENCETYIQRRKIPDLIDPPEIPDQMEKTSAEGKTLC